MSSNLSVFLRWPAVVSAILFLGAAARAIYIGGVGGGVAALMIPMGLFLVVAPGALVIAWVEGGNSAMPADWARWTTRWNKRLIWAGFAFMNLWFLGVIWRPDLFVPHGPLSR